MRPHAIELLRIERARRPQAASQQREPTIPARKHLCDQAHQLTPALIAHGESALDRCAEGIRPLCDRARLAASWYDGRASSSSLSRPPAPEAMGNCAAARH